MSEVIHIGSAAPPDRNQWGLAEMKKLQQIFLIKNSGGRAKFSGLTQGIRKPFSAKEARKVGKGEEALFYYITRRMKNMLIAIISFKGKTA